MSDLALVTGGSGYFGSALVAKLLTKGYRVRVFDLLDAEDRPTDVEFVAGDIRDPQAIALACQNVDVVHHNVAMVPLAKDSEAFWTVNRDGTRNLLEASRTAGVDKVVYTSSSAVFGVPDSLPVTEETKPLPAESYGEAKLAGEDLCWQSVEAGLDVSIIRPRTIMGHGRLGIMQMLFEWIRQGRNVPVLDGGKNCYQFVHASDLGDACVLAGARSGARAYNIGADNYGSMRELLENLAAYAGTGTKVRSLPSAPAVLGMKLTSKLGLSPLGAYHALMYGKDMWFDCTRAKTELNWAPQFSNDEMFRESYDWYVSHREQVLTQDSASQHRSPVKQGILNLVSRLL